jgi:hypothetical protein
VQAKAPWAKGYHFVLPSWSTPIIVAAYDLTVDHTFDPTFDGEAALHNGKLYRRRSRPPQWQMQTNSMHGERIQHPDDCNAVKVMSRMSEHQAGYITNRSGHRVRATTTATATSLFHLHT